MSERARCGCSTIDRKIWRDRERGGERTARERERAREWKGSIDIYKQSERVCEVYQKRETTSGGYIWGREIEGYI